MHRCACAPTAEAWELALTQLGEAACPCITAYPTTTEDAVNPSRAAAPLRRDVQEAAQGGTHIYKATSKILLKQAAAPPELLPPGCATAE